MPSLLTPLRDTARTAARDALYSRPCRALARAVVSGGALEGVRHAIEERGQGDMLRRLASQPLPRGQRYLRLTITGWKKLIGREFRLLQNGEVVYGNRISAPPEGQPLEYRNIVVDSDDPADFELDIRAKFKIAVGPGAFTTPEQDSYDRRYHVQQHRGLHYTVRGNTENPSRLIVTFPGFPPKNARVSYAVSYLKALTAEDLSDTLMICFQDRYGVAGTYMLFDNAGAPLHDRITATITELMRRHRIPEHDVLLFGASKGASIAATAARDLPEARQVLVVPQMSLPYYCAKPVLRHGLYRDRRLWDAEQPGELLRDYLAEGRRIDWFYTDSDQDSNLSMIEYTRDAPGLTKHRVDGKHAAVAKKSLPTVLAMLRAFAAGGAPEDRPTADGPMVDAVSGAVDGPTAERAEERDPLPLTCTDLAATVHEDGVSFTATLDVPSADGGPDGDLPEAALPGRALPEGANVYLEGELGGTRFRQLLTRDADADVSRTSSSISYSTGPAQRLDPALHPATSLTRIVAFDGGPRMLAGDLPAVRITGGDTALPTAAPIPMPDALECTTESPAPYALLGASLRPSTQVTYASSPVDADGEEVEVVVVPDGPEPLLEAGLRALEPGGSAPRARFVVAADGTWRDLDLFVRRAAVAARTDAARVVLADPSVTDAQVSALSALYGVDMEVVDRRPVAGAAARQRG